METVTQGGQCHFVCLHVKLIWKDQVFNQTNNNDNNNNKNRKIKLENELFHLKILQHMCAFKVEKKFLDSFIFDKAEVFRMVWSS